MGTLVRKMVTLRLWASHFNTFMRASNGEKTMVTLSFTTAGSWKHRDFPEPVGMDTNTSCLPVKNNCIYVYAVFLMNAKKSFIHM
jgi:hypothetical protein